MTTVADEIYWNRKALLDDVERRSDELLRPCAQAIDDFVSNLFSRPFAADWRDRWREFVDEWRSRGRLNDATSLREFEMWLEAWAMFTGHLPDDGGYRMAQEDGMWVAYRVGTAPERSRAVHGANNSRTAVAAMLVGYRMQPTSTSTNAEPKESGSKPANSDGATETAGPGPETSAMFQDMVRLALQILDPKVARWWKAPSVSGLVRSRDATSWPAAWRFNAYSEMQGDRPIITVDMHFTAGETAQAIMREVETGWFADSIGAYYRKYKFAKTPGFEEFRKWQQGATSEAARLASVMAELYYNSIANLTPGGDLLLTVGDLAENRPRWDHLLSLLPLLGHLPIGVIILKLGKRTIKLPKALVRKLEALDAKARKVLLEQAEKAAKTDDEARAIIERELLATAPPPTHHIATNKNWISSLRGGPWSPRFEKLFKKAGMTLQDAANTIPLPGHRGPHPERYHEEIYRRLVNATRGKNGAEYRTALLDELQRIADEIARPGTVLNRLLTS